MKGLIPVEDQPNTREHGQTVEGVGGLVEEGLGVVVPREDAYAGVSIDYPTDQQNVLRYIRIPRHSAAKALDIPEQSMYEEVGKPTIHGRPHYRRAFTLNAKTLTIDAWPAEAGLMGKRIYMKAVQVARGLQMSLADGANIEVPSSAPLGAQREVAGYSPVNLNDLYTR